MLTIYSSSPAYFSHVEVDGELHIFHLLRIFNAFLETEISFSSPNQPWDDTIAETERNILDTLVRWITADSICRLLIATLSCSP
jgi:hypothetical protein